MLSPTPDNKPAPLPLSQDQMAWQDFIVAADQADFNKNLPEALQRSLHAEQLAIRLFGVTSDEVASSREYVKRFYDAIYRDCKRRKEFAEAEQVALANIEFLNERGLKFDPNLADLFQKAGDAAFCRNETTLAINYYQDAIDLRYKLEPNAHLKQCYAYYSLAASSYNLLLSSDSGEGELTDAIFANLTKISSLKLELLEPNEDCPAAKLLEEVGDFYIRLGISDEADLCYTKSLEILAKVEINLADDWNRYNSKEYTANLQSQINLSIKLIEIQISDERFDAAHYLYEEIIEIGSLLYRDPANHSEFIKLRSLDAVIFQKEGLLFKAEQVLRQVIELQRTLSSSEEGREYLARYLHQLAVVCIGAHKLSEANNCLDEALQIVGDEPSYLQASLRASKADLNLEGENYFFAESDCAQALEILSLLDESTDPRIYMLKMHVGFTQASITVQRGIEARSNDDHISVDELAAIAEAQCEEVREKFEKLFDDCEVVTELDLQGEIALLRNDTVGALKCFEEALETQLNSLAIGIKQERTCAELRINIGRCYLDLNKPGTAIGYFSKALEDMQELPEGCATETTQRKASLFLAQAYRRNGQADKAHACEALADSLEVSLEMLAE